jgi:hypothetical protein
MCRMEICEKDDVLTVRRAEEDIFRQIDLLGVRQYRRENEG